MPKVSPITQFSVSPRPPHELLQGKRHLTAKEVYILIQNRNISSDPDWQNVYVSDTPGEFFADQIVQSEFSGWVVLGVIRPVTLKFHDLELKCGIYRSVLSNVATGDDCVLHNVSYLHNYRLGDRVMLFNIQEMSCTCHSKFGEGILKDGEPESNRYWIDVGNENGGRGILPFTSMIPADAYIWSRYREDKKLMDRFVELTESENDGAQNTYGIVDDDAVIKNCTLLKDAKIGKCAYIKGAFKLKNITVLSSEDEPSQIGEGVELVNGIMGYGSHVFYQAVAVRFVIGRNCHLKYGGRLLNSVLGDNSTVSCCELLNNLIFPFHEQHHNSSFLIAATIMGQSNIASAATIGSNHNSRSPDGEMIAGRGFWPGLCSDFKYDSKFASFVLVAKGSYQNELNITYPFSLVAPSGEDGAVHIIPAYWFIYNMFAIVRNKYKFKARDKRVVKVQHIETDPLAPDTIQEVVTSLDRLIELTSRYLKMGDAAIKKATEYNPAPALLEDFRKRISAAEENDSLKIAKDYLHQNKLTKFSVIDDRCQKKYGAKIYKIPQGYTEYRRIVKYFSVDSIMAWTHENGKEILTVDRIAELEKIPLHKKWTNAGGQVIPDGELENLFGKIKGGEINNWEQVHEFYKQVQSRYTEYKARYGLHLLEQLYSRPISSFTPEIFSDITGDVLDVSNTMLSSSFSSREKDYTDFFRTVTFRNKEEMESVLGTIKDSSFLRDLKNSTEDFNSRVTKLFSELNTD
ncbi:MAG: DUF4954 family protein [Treponema sp.]|nr:DUF4954 family protein [Treponema sp.]